MKRFTSNVMVVPTMMFLAAFLPSSLPAALHRADDHKAAAVNALGLEPVVSLNIGSLASGMWCGLRLFLESEHII